MSEEVKAPDINTDRFMLVTGGTIPCMTRPEFPVIRSKAKGVRVPLSPTTPEGMPQRDADFEVGLEVHVGTVDEHVEIFRKRLTQAFEILACKNDDGTYGVIPVYGEASLRRQTEILREMGIDRPVESATLEDVRKQEVVA